MREIAKTYIEHGFEVVPTKEDKSPNCDKWRGVVVDLSEFDKCEGIGLKCGNASSGLECFDFDNKFGDAKHILSQYLNIPEVKEIYQKYKLPIESTVSGGYHVLFRCQYNEGNLKLAQRGKHTDKGIKPVAIIETRGEGGYFVCAPTKGYSVVRNNILETNEITKEERQTLINFARTFNEYVKPNRQELEEKERPGDFFNNRNEAIDEMKSCLLKHGWKELSNFLWRRPDKDKGITATIGKVAPNVFYNFSSNSHPFEENSGYLPFQVIGLLDYQGDFKKFAQDISQRYNLSTPDTYHQKEKEKEEKQLTVDELDELLSLSYIDPEIPIDKPPVVLEINHSETRASDYRRLMTLGNFSAITGKSKSKKTFLTSTILAALAKNGYDNDYKFKATLLSDKRNILHFDTEQSKYDAYVTVARIHKMLKGDDHHIASFGLREYTRNERLKIIKYAIEKYRHNLSFVMIDGIADLINSNNDEQEANEISQLLMKWTSIYNIHICVILHQNKKDNFATGWIGTQIMKKAELVMAVEKLEGEDNTSQVTCDVIRGVKEFPKFNFYVDENGMPVIGDNISSL